MEGLSGPVCYSSIPYDHVPVEIEFLRLTNPHSISNLVPLVKYRSLADFFAVNRETHDQLDLRRGRLSLTIYCIEI